MIPSKSAPKGAWGRFVRTFSLAAGMASTGILLQAQNVSYQLNNIPLGGGNNNVGIGNGVLSVNTADDNIAIGTNALISNGTGWQNVAVGRESMFSNSNGSFNAAYGANALRNNTTGGYNVAIGNGAMGSKITGNLNTAVGYLSLGGTTYSAYATAIGAYAMYSASGATFNTAVGYSALMNATGSYNTALGANVLAATTFGTENTAVGHNAMTTNTSGTQNTAMGTSSLSSNSSGKRNCALGTDALYSNSAGERNVAAGYQALNVNTIGSQNTGLGYLANVSVNNLSNATALGTNAVTNNNNKIRLGSTTTTVIEGQVAYTFPSDGRFKTNVRSEDVVGLDFIQRLRPVVYNFETRRFTEFLTQNMPDSLRQQYLAEDFGPSTAVRQSGFIAQEVEQAAKDAGYDFDGVHTPTHDGDNYAVAYSQFVVPLVKGMQEQQAMIEDMRARDRAQQAQIAELQAQVRLLLANAGGSDAATRQAVEVFPNPSMGRFTVRLSTPGASQLEVLDLQGRTLRQLPVSADQVSHTVELGDLAKGTYILRVYGPAGLIATQELIKQ